MILFDAPDQLFAVVDESYVRLEGFLGGRAVIADRLDFGQTGDERAVALFRELLGK